MALRVTYGEDPPVGWVRYLNAQRGGGTAVQGVAIEVARVTGLPDVLDAIVATSDLQGVVADRATGASTLLGIAVAETLAELADDGALPPAARTGVLLAGDLYSVPAADKRGGHGDVAEVWAAFAGWFAWVAGVAGNHDDVERVARGENVHLLDTDQVTIDGLRLGGVGLIAGNPAKRGRRDEDDQLARIELAADGVDILLLHEGPEGDGRGQRGHPRIRAIVEAAQVPLTICGHDHWDSPLATCAHGGAILNVDARVIVLRR
jgi:Icc protein